MAGAQSAGAKPTMRASTSPRGAAAADSPPVVLDGTAGAAGADPYHVAAVTTSATTRSSATPARPRRARGSSGSSTSAGDSMGCESSRTGAGRTSGRGFGPGAQGEQGAGQP